MTLNNPLKVTSLFKTLIPHYTTLMKLSANMESYTVFVAVQGQSRSFAIVIAKKKKV